MSTVFAYPWCLSTLVLLVVLGLLVLRGRRLRRHALEGLGSGLNLSSTRAARRHLRGVCLVLGLLLLGVGAAGPQWGLDWDQAASPGRDLVVVLDESRSMLAEKPSRLERACAALLEFADFLKKRGGDRLALVVFAARPRLVCPLTHDYDHFRETVAAINPDVPNQELAATADSISGTRIGLALQLAVLAHTASDGGARAILLLSDGDDPAHGDGEWGEGLAAARAAGIPVLTVGLGDPDEASPVPGGRTADDHPAPLEYQGQPVRSRLEEGLLREIALGTGGTYEPARRQTPPLGPLYSQMVAARSMREENEDALPVYRQRPLWFLTPALVLLVMATVLGDGPVIRTKT